MLNRPNVILVTADSLRADRLGCYGYSRPTSPNLDLFCKDAIRFSNAFTNGPNTPHAFPAIMSANCPLTHSRLGLFDAPLTLAEALRNAGYATIGFNAANPYVSRMFNYDRGFDEFYDYMDGSELLDDSSGSADFRIGIPKMDLEKYLVSEESIHRKACLESEINARIFERLENFPRPFLLWAHFMDTHYPYLPQPEAQQEVGIPFVSREENFRINSRVRENIALSSELLHKVQNLYDATVRQLDAKLGDLFGFLQQNGLYDSSLIVFCADHGEEFLEHGDLQHKSKLFDELLRVPLLIKPPFAARSERRDEIVSLIDLAPTIFSLLKLENPFPQPGFLHSMNYFSDSGSFLIAEASYAANGGPPVDRQLFNIDTLPKRFAYRERFWKMIFDTDEEKPVLYNLLSDPFEKTAIHESSESTRMLAILENHIRRQEGQRLTERISRVRKKLNSLSTVVEKEIISF